MIADLDERENNCGREERPQIGSWEALRKGDNAHKQVWGFDNKLV